MDRRVFVAVFAAMGSALGVAMLALGVVFVAEGANRTAVLPGLVTLALVGVVVAVGRASAPKPAGSRPPGPAEPHV